MVLAGVQFPVAGRGAFAGAASDISVASGFAVK